MTISRDENVALLRRVQNESRFEGVRRGVTGNGVDNDPRANLQPGYVWVRLSDQRDPVAVQGNAVQIGVPVLVEPAIDGGYRIADIDTTAVPPNQIAILQQTIQPPVTSVSGVLDGKNFRPGRVRVSEDGGLYVWVEGFGYDYGQFGGGIGGASDPVTEGGANLLLVPTATANKIAAVVVYYDTYEGELAQTLTADHDAGYTFVKQAILEEADLSADCYPLAAVILANGATAIDGAKILDLRMFLNRRELIAGEMLYLYQNYY